MDSTPPENGPSGPSWIIDEAAAALGVRSDPARLSEAARALGPAPGWDALDRLAEAGGMRLMRWKALPREAVAVASPRCPVVARTPDGGWILVIDAVRGGARVRREGGDTRAEVLPLEALRHELGGAGDGPLEWGLLEAATPFDPHAGEHAEHLSPWERLWRLVRVEQRDLGIVVVYAIGIGVLSLVVPVAVQTLVNTVVFGTLLTPILWLSLLVLGGLIFAAVLQLAQVWVVEVLQRRVFVNLVSELAWRLPRSRLEALDRTNAPVLVNRFFDVVTLQKSIAVLLLDGVAVVISGVAGTLLLALYHPYLLGYAVLLWAALAAVLRATGSRGPRTAIAESYAKHEVASWMEELAANPQTFQTGGGQRWAWAKADALARAYLEARHVHFRVWFGQVAALLLLYATASALLLTLGGGLVVAGQLSIGQLMAAELVVSAVLGSFAKLGKQLEKLYDLLASLDKLGHLLEVPLDRTDGDALPAGSGPLAVEMAGLAYRYDDDRAVFDGISATLRPGERVALLSSAGSGKRTLLDLLVGSRTPSGGWIRLDGVDLRDLRLEDVRRHVALVRGTEIVEGTLAENVHLGRPGVGPEQVRSALARVGLLDEAAALPDGLRTELAANGRPLSGSQARRLVLARALAGSPRLLLVDDLVDTLSARARDKVLDALLGASRSATTLIVTRDPEVARRCDRVIELNRPAPPVGSTLSFERSS